MTHLLYIWDWSPASVVAPSNWEAAKRRQFVIKTNGLAPRHWLWFATAEGWRCGACQYFNRSPLTACCSLCLAPAGGPLCVVSFFGAVVPMLQLTTAVSHSPTLKPNKQKYHRGFTPHGSDKNWSGHTAVMVVRTHKVCLISWPRVAQGWRVAVVIVVGSNGVAALPLPIRWCAQYLVTTMNPPGRHCDYSDQVCSWLDNITRGKVGGRLSKKSLVGFWEENNIFS